MRASGMRLPGSWRPEPSGSSARYLSPRTVLMAMAAVVRSPSQASSTSKVTLTLAPSSATPVTRPTLTPAQRLAEPLSAAFEGLRDGGQGRGELLRLDGGEHRQHVVEHLLELDGVRGPVLGDDGPGGQGFGRGVRGRDEGHEPFAEQGGGQHLGADVGRYVVQRAGFHGEGEPGPVAGCVDGADLADDDPAQLHLGARVHLVAGAAGLDDHRVGVGELLVVDGDGQPDQQGGHQHEHHSGQPVAQGGSLRSAHLTPPPSRSWSRPTGPGTGRSR
ncbi:hypothetical protein SVIOM342S_02336 [Streptomyces violaceorubidus]